MAKLRNGMEIGRSAYQEFVTHPHDRADPSAWNALFLDRSLPMDLEAKATYLKTCRSWSHQFLLPLIRPFCRLAIAFNKILRTLLPNQFCSSKALHYLIYLGQKYFVSPEANYVILRHFHLGSQILAFVSANVPGFHPGLKAIRPTKLEDIYKDEIYLNHDINLYNFIIALNEHFREHKTTVNMPEKIDYSAIQQGDFGIEGLRDTWLNFLDIETAIEIFTPLYQLFLSDNDFWRAHHSLQFDETIAIYVSSIIGHKTHLSLVNNRHPLAPLNSLNAAYRLVLHGLASELLHGLLAAEARVHSQGTRKPMLHA